MRVIHTKLPINPGDSSWRVLVKEFKDTVNTEGSARASWDCIDRHLHLRLAQQLKKDLAFEYWDWEIDYWSYTCIARRRGR